jgi:hypothetical protein
MLEIIPWQQGKFNKVLVDITPITMYVFNTFVEISKFSFLRRKLQKNIKRFFAQCCPISKVCANESRWPDDDATHVVEQWERKICAQWAALLKMQTAKNARVWRGRLQGCRIFVGTLYQNRKKCTKWSQNFPNVPTIFQMAIKYISIFQSRAPKTYPTWDWFLVRK